MIIIICVIAHDIVMIDETILNSINKLNIKMGNKLLMFENYWD